MPKRSVKTSTHVTLCLQTRHIEQVLHKLENEIKNHFLCAECILPKPPLQFHDMFSIKISFTLLFPISIDRCLLSLPDTLHNPHHSSGLIHISPLQIPSLFPLQNSCWCQGEHLLMLMTFLGREKVQARQKRGHWLEEREKCMM